MQLAWQLPAHLPRQLSRDSTQPSGSAVLDSSSAPPVKQHVTCTQGQRMCEITNLSAMIDSCQLHVTTLVVKPNLIV